MKKGKICTSVALLLIACSLLVDVHGHGFVKTPRSRNWVAAEDGLWWGGADDLPQKENCPSCANTKTPGGFCGIVDSRNYDEPKDSIGRPLAPQAQAIYTEGEVINMEFVFTANHKGHHVTHACPDFNNPTEECFNQYPLEFVEDKTVERYETAYNAPKDPNYPNRGYVDPGASHTFMRFKLPEGLTGDLVLLRWHYVTGNSCRSPGYDSYNYPPGWNPPNMAPCPDPLSPIGEGAPEQFWNCMEVKILPAGSNPPSSPTPTPPTPNPPAPNPPAPNPPAPNPPAPNPPTPNPPSPMPPSPPSSGSGCCSLAYAECDAAWCGSTETECNACGSDVIWLPNGPNWTCLPKWSDCTNNINGCCSPAVCIGDQWYKQCLDGESNPPPSPLPPSPPPPTVPPPTPSPPSPNPPSGSNTLFSTSTTRSSYAALQELDSITHIIPGSNPPIYVIVAEGGAAGVDTVISEGQGYAIMIAGITLAAMDTSDPNYQDTMNRFFGYFSGWKTMCRNSSTKAFCQDKLLCDGGATPCLPGWKHDKDLTTVIGSGAAPDGDQDAIVGMILAIKALENVPTKPSWYGEVSKWADASATSFLYHNTKMSKSGNSHRIVKLGTCWGGWETEGQNPSYHSPGSYRLMKNYQKDFLQSVRGYTMPNFDDGLTLESRWDKVIDTSYSFLEQAQCDETGLVPNWAQATEMTNGEISLYPGSFSGSGTPQYEFGSEASRTIWRVLFDVALYPNEAFAKAANFLSPLHYKLVQEFTGSNWNEAALMTCPGVTSVFTNWQNNAFMYSPVYTSLVLKANGVDDTVQQNMVDIAGSLVDAIPSGLSYFSRCWAIIGILTLNGDIEKASQNHLNSTPPAPTPPSPTLTPPTPPTHPTPPTIVNPDQCCPSGFTGLKSMNNCAQYYHCVNGVVHGIPHPCAETTLFQNSIQNCNWIDQFVCDETPCDDGNSPSPPTPSPPSPTPPSPTPPSPTPPSPTPPTPTSNVPCGGGTVGNGICSGGLCCSEWGWCGSSAEHCNGSSPPPPSSPSPPSPPSPTPASAGGLEDNRMIAYVGNWQPCPTPQQVAAYTHIVISFAVSYTWSPGKNICSPTCEIATPPVCNNAPNQGLIDDWKNAGKKVLLSFGGAGMGGSWDGNNDCWEYCFGREDQVITRITQIVNEMGLDGVDIDYEYFYVDGQNQFNWNRGAEAQKFLKDITVGLKNSLDPGSIITHAPMDTDVVHGTEYYNLLVEVSSSLDFLMPQYYNGVIRPLNDGFAPGSPGINHFDMIRNDMFNGDATKIVFGFCISDCSGTGTNTAASNAVSILEDLEQTHACHGGAFFWVADHDVNGVWSSTVGNSYFSNAGCSNAPSPTTTSPTTTSPTTTSPTTTSPTTTSPAPTPSPTPSCSDSNKQLLMLNMQVDENGAAENFYQIRWFNERKSRWRFVVNNKNLENNGTYSYSKCMDVNVCYQLRIFDRRKNGFGHFDFRFGSESFSGGDPLNYPNAKWIQFHVGDCIDILQKQNLWYGDDDGMDSAYYYYEDVSNDDASTDDSTRVNDDNCFTNLFEQISGLFK